MRWNAFSFSAPFKRTFFEGYFSQLQTLIIPPSPSRLLYAVVFSTFSSTHYFHDYVSSSTFLIEMPGSCTHTLTRHFFPSSTIYFNWKPPSDHPLSKQDSIASSSCPSSRHIFFSVHETSLFAFLLQFFLSSSSTTLQPSHCRHHHDSYSHLPFFFKFSRRTHFPFF